jgi:predicted RNA-binding protein
MRFWVLTGSVENWETALNRKYWGARQKLKKIWDKISIGDILAFYASSPVSGLIGFGKVENKSQEDYPLWPDEVKTNSIIYPYRFKISIEYALDVKDVKNWKDKRVFVNDLRIPFQAGINSLSNRDKIASLLARAGSQWEKDFSYLLPAEVKEIIKKVEKLPSIHNTIRDMLCEIGKMEGKYSEKEYSIDGQVDVIWKRIPQGNPIWVFEVQIGGDIYHALAKLKHAFDLWNSNLYLVISEKDVAKAKELLGGAFHEIKDKIKFITAAKVEKWYKLREEDIETKLEFGLIHSREEPLIL